MYPLHSQTRLIVEQNSVIIDILSEIKIILSATVFCFAYFTACIYYLCKFIDLKMEYDLSLCMFLKELTLGLKKKIIHKTILVYL